jgi:hypothetical protein
MLISYIRYLFMLIFICFENTNTIENNAGIPQQASKKSDGLEVKINKIKYARINVTGNRN